MRAKSRLRERIERILPGKSIVVRGARRGTKEYVLANNYCQRIRAASDGKIIFSLKCGKQNLTITRATSANGDIA